jgi:CheY-like chemotaxis protein
MKRVAIIEDNADNRMLLHALLEELYAVTSYPSGRLALEGMLRERPDVVLLDISLPHMEGTDLLAEVRTQQRLRRVPVVAVTAHAMRGDRERYLGMGFDEYLAQPVLDDAQMAQVIDRLIARGG